MPPSDPKSEGTSGVFVSTIAAINGGKLITKLDDAMREATRAAREAVAKSKITVELSIVPNGEGVGGEPLFKVAGKVKKTLPEKAEPASNFFVDDGDNLSRRNPKQEEIKLTVHEGGADRITREDLKAAAGK